MPRYEWACHECHTTHEATLTTVERYEQPEPVCAVCKKPMRLLIFAPALAGSRKTEGKA